VTVTGTNLAAPGAPTSVSFGTATVPATSVSADGTRLTVTSPANVVGTVDITVTTTGGTSAVTASDRFTYHTSVREPVQLSAAPEVIGFLPFRVVAQPTATLTAGGQPLAGQLLAFTSSLGQPLCTTYTDEHGMASCTVAPIAMLLSSGYFVTYLGTDDYLPATATAKRKSTL
jgi:hypothetical protein